MIEWRVSATEYHPAAIYGVPPGGYGKMIPVKNISSFILEYGSEISTAIKAVFRFASG